jgi:signal transduction histidine kinase
MTTGRPFHIFLGHQAGALLATGAAAAITIGVVANATAHISWHLDWGTDTVRHAVVRGRSALLVVAPAFIGITLSRTGSATSGAADAAIGAIAAVIVLIACLLEIRHTTVVVSWITRALYEISATVGETTSSNIHSQVRTQMRTVLSSLKYPCTPEEIASGRLSVKLLLARVDQTRHSLVHEFESAGLETLLDEAFLNESRLRLIDGLEAKPFASPADERARAAFGVKLSGADVELARIALGDLVDNALRYTEGPVLVGLGIDSAAGLIVLRVQDHGFVAWDQGWLKGGSLGSLGNLLRRHGGDLTVSENQMGHVLIASWTPEPGQSASKSLQS